MGTNDFFCLILLINEKNGLHSKKKMQIYGCGSPPGVMMADTLSFNAKIGVVDF